MCTIAGYNGSKRAAPILIDMMRKMEGLDSGFYTGMATMHEGKIYYAKITGDLDRFLHNTNALDLPGNMGFIHSRTPGGAKVDHPGVAHPFTDEVDGNVKTALIMNGCGGVFGPTIKAVTQGIAEKLEQKGYTIKSRHPVVGNLTLPDGTKMHSTDVRCQLTSSMIDEGMDAACALMETFKQIPGESVSLVLTLKEPEAICFARLVMPMHVAFCDSGAYMATAPLAIPEDAGNYTLLPAMSYGKVFKNRFEASPFADPPVTVAPITPQVMAAAYNYIEQKLKEPIAFTKIGWTDVLKDLYPKADCTQRGTVAYEIISEFARQGRLNVETRYIDGQAEGLKAPVFYLSLK